MAVTRQYAADLASTDSFHARLQYETFPMPVQLHARDVQAWYTGDRTLGSYDPAREAFDEAVALFKKDLTKEECKKIGLGEKSTMHDVISAITKTRSEYDESAKKGKIRQWLTRCAQRMDHYGNVMDVLVQGAPDYASLIWGVFKFLFMTLVNHDELLLELSKAVSNIANVLPRVDLHAVLYPTDRMRKAVSELHVKILEFVQAAMTYYKSGSIKKTFTAAIKPFPLSFKQNLEDIGEASRQVDDLANAALKAEIRDLHLQVRQLTQITLMTQSLQNQMSADITSQKVFYQAAQLELLQELPMLKDAPGRVPSLEYCKSMTRRRRSRVPITLSTGDMRDLKSWLSTSTSGVLIGEAHGIKTSSRDFAVDLIDLVLKAKVSAIWALPNGGAEVIVPSIESILASLVVQAIELNPSVLSAQMDPITMKHFKATYDADEWLRLLRKAIQGLQYLLIVVDLSMIRACLKGESAWEPEEFLEKLVEMSRSTKTVVKIVALTWRLDQLIQKDADDKAEMQWIATDPGPRTVRLMRTPKFRMALTARRRKMAQELRDQVWIGAPSETGLGAAD